MSSIIGIIPARYLSTRFPGKPLARIGSKSMICRVYDQCIKSDLLDKVYVATDDDRIYQEVTGQGGLAVMTDPSLVNGTERCFDAYRQIEMIEGKFDYLVNIQGDEPFIHPEQISEICRLIASTPATVATLVKVIEKEADLWDENVVKVVTMLNGLAMYFSRHPIPFIRGAEKESWLKKRAFLKHIGIYAFKTESIDLIRSLPPTGLEKAENLEQLRWLKHGLTIATGITRYSSLAVDTPADLEKAIQYIQSNA